MLEVIFASIGYAGGVISDKIILGKYRVPVMRFIPLLFIWLAVITAIFLPMWGSVNFILLKSVSYLALFALMIVVAVAWNIYYYRGIQQENLAEFELIMLFSPLATVIFAAIFLPSERNWAVFVAGLLSSLALIWSRARRHHIQLSRVAKKTILAMILLSFESVLIKELLAVFSPVSLYFARTLVVAIVFIAMYKPKILQMPRTTFALTIISAIFGVIQMVLKFYGFASLGVIETTMILLFGPFLVYIFSYIYFRERLYHRDILAVATIVLSILYIQFWQ